MNLFLIISQSFIIILLLVLFSFINYQILKVLRRLESVVRLMENTIKSADNTVLSHNKLSQMLNG